MYQLGPIDLLSFGLIPSVVDNSTNLALSGCWDFPARLGKSFQDWNDDQNGVEPYVREEEIRLAGRDITFVALLSAASENAALLKCYELYKLVGGLNSLVPFTTDLGTFNVYLKDQVIADYIGDGWCKLKFTFREPILNYAGTIPAASNAGLGIDGIAFKDLGLTVLDVTGRWNRPAPKNFKATFYENEGYKVSALQNREVTIKALLSGANYTQFVSYLNGLYLLFKKEGLRYITYENDMYRSFFVKDGFQVSNVLQAGNGETTGVLTCKFTEVTASSDWSFLMTSTGSELTDKLGQKIIVLPPAQEANLDFTLTVQTTLPNSVPNAGGTYELQIASNAEFFVLESHSFLSLSDSAGQNEGVITVKVDSNASTARTGTITVLAGDKVETITVAQGAATKVPYCTVDQSAVTATNAAEVKTITISSNTSWTLSADASWVTLNKQSGANNDTFTISIAANATAFVRNAIVSVTAGSIVRYIAVQQAATANNSAEADTNLTKQVDKLTSFEQVVPLSVFANNNSTETYTFTDGFIRPKWAVWLQTSGKAFLQSGLKPWEVGLAGSTDYVAGFDFGWGVRAVDYVLSDNPDTGQPYAGGIDPATVSVSNPNGISYNDFISAIPYWHRVNGQGILNDNNTPTTLVGCYDAGNSFARVASLGFGDNINNKTRRGFTIFDFESTSVTEAKQVAALIGAAMGSNARISEHYTTPLNLIGYNNPDHTVKEYNYPNEDGTYPSNAEYSAIWNYQNPLKIDISERNISQKSVLDYPNIQPMLEISAYYSYFMLEGSVMSLGSKQITIKKFGNVYQTDWNVIHGLAHYGYLTELMSYYCNEKLNRIPLISAKLISDRNDRGLDEYLIADDGSVVLKDPTVNRANFLHSRKWGFLIGLLMYMNKAEWFWWDRTTDNSGSLYNPNRTQDGYVGGYGIIKMVKDSGGIAKFLEMQPLYWKTEYSLDGGATWKTSKAWQWKTSKTDVLPVRVKVSSTSFEVAAFRPEGCEPVAFKVRVVINGTTIIKTVSADMWQTVNPVYKNTALSLIPSSDKDYYYKHFTV